MIKMIFSEHQNVEKEICVCLNDEETRILFVDQKHGDMSVSQRLKSNFVVAESTVFIFTSLQDLVLISELLFFLCYCISTVLVLSVFSRGWKTLYASEWQMSFPLREKQTFNVSNLFQSQTVFTVLLVRWQDGTHCTLVDPPLSSLSPRWPATGRTPTSWWWPWTPRVLWTRLSGSWPTSGCPGPWRTGPWCWWPTRLTSSRAGPSNPWRESRWRYTTTSSTLRHLRVNRYDWARYNNWISLYFRD